MSTAIITLDQLSVHTQGQLLVEPISLTLYQGQSLTILGETGSGKSLLAQAIMGALPDALSTTGDITLYDQRQTKDSIKAHWGKTLAMLAQEPTQSLDPTMRIIDQVQEGFYYIAKLPKPTAKQRAISLLSELGLAAFADYYPHQLSGGMAQRAAFAVATAGGARIVIADEPTKGLDEHNRQIVIDLLKHIVISGGTLLTITHDIAVATALAQTDQARLMVMKQGVLLEQGDAKQVLSAPRSAYAQALIDACPSRWQSSTATPKLGEPLLTLNDVGLKRGDRWLFDKLNLTIHQGDIIGITGQSGIGKSTLGNLLCGLITPTKGYIQWHQSVARHQIQKLYQDPPSAFSPHQSLQVLIDDLVSRHGLDRQAIPALMTSLQLDPTLLTRSSRDVSGGELQRIAILRSLLLKPVLLFADETTSRLDPITQQHTMTLLVEQCQRYGCSLIIVSHELDLVRHYCHSIINLGDYQTT